MTAHTNCFLFISLLGVHSSHQDYFTWFDPFPALCGSLPKPCTRLFTSLGKIQSQICADKSRAQITLSGALATAAPVLPTSSPSRQRAEQFSMLLLCHSMLFPPLSIYQRQNRPQWQLRWQLGQLWAWCLWLNPRFPAAAFTLQIKMRVPEVHLIKTQNTFPAIMWNTSFLMDMNMQKACMTAGDGPLLLLACSYCSVKS